MHLLAGVTADNFDYRAKEQKTRYNQRRNNRCQDI